MKKFRRCIAGGVFAIIHPGHIYFLKKAKELCEKLYVVVSHDKRMEEKYGYVVPQHLRKNMLLSLKYVDEVILGKEEIDWDLAKKLKVDAVIVGCDQPLPPVDGIEVIRIDCFEKEKYSTSRLIKWKK